jgi:hypothetical protein
MAGSPPRQPSRASSTPTRAAAELQTSTRLSAAFACRPAEPTAAAPRALRRKRTSLTTMPRAATPSAGSPGAPRAPRNRRETASEAIERAAAARKRPTAKAAMDSAFSWP